MNTKILTFVCAFTFVGSAQVGAIDPNRLHNEQEQEKKQKYTCPMHPEVVMDHPGNCPKCGMKLVPKAEKKRPTSNVQRPTSKSGDMMHHEHDMAMSHHLHGAHEMHPPSHEGHEMHMEMHSSINLADPMNREG